MDLTNDDLMKILNTEEKTFVDNLVTALSSTTFDDKYSVKLNKDLINILKSNPEYFNSFEKIFLDIISDNKINPSDIPNLLLLLKKLYEILFNINSKGISIDTYKSILKFIVDIIVTEKVSDVQKRQELLSLVHILIDTSCELITFRQVLKSNKPSIFFLTIV